MKKTKKFSRLPVITRLNHIIYTPDKKNRSVFFFGFFPSAFVHPPRGCKGRREDKGKHKFREEEGGKGQVEKSPNLPKHSSFHQVRPGPARNITVDLGRGRGMSKSMSMSMSKSTNIRANVNASVKA